MPQSVTLPCYRATVIADWVDYNGHLRDAFYMLLFSFAADALIDLIGLPEAVRTARRRSIFTLEAHINYLHEIEEGAQIRIDMRVLGHDAKRLHLYMEMFAGEREQHDEAVAASEQMLLHVDMQGPRSVAFDPDVAERVSELAGAHAGLPPPAFAGRVIALPKQTAR